MFRATTRASSLLAAALALGLAPAALGESPADDPAASPPRLSIRPPADSVDPVRTAMPPRPSKGLAGSRGAEKAGSWWFGPSGVALALAAAGALSLAARRRPGGPDLGPLRVVGRVKLSPKQSVHLVRVGDRVLILGTGPQGAPTALGEVTDPAEVARLAVDRRPSASPSTATTGPQVAAPARTGRFDHRIGDDE